MEMAASSWRACWMVDFPSFSFSFSFFCCCSLAFFVTFCLHPSYSDNAPCIDST